MERRLALIGFGEAARGFAPGLCATIRSYDLRIREPGMREAMVDMDVLACDGPAAALADAVAVFSLVTADQALVAAQACGGIAPGALWFDMNSVAPDTKRAAAQAIGKQGGRYVDVAIMAPVQPKRTAVPILVAGPEADEGAALLRTLGFKAVTVIGDTIGAAAAVKMIRSIMIKGIEALSAECVLAAEAAGVRAAVIASLEESDPGADWTSRFDYNLDRMMVHGLRRAAEMKEVVKTVDALKTGSAMSRATAERQAEIGVRKLAPPAGLGAKLRALAA